MRTTNGSSDVAILKSRIHLIAMSTILFCAQSIAQVEDEEIDQQRDFDLPGADVAGLEGDGGLELADVDFVGNPAKNWFEKWPADLVIAPIPGRSPQLGWKLTLAGGYFLNPRDEESETAPSIVGGFAMVAENGSYAYGAGGNFHLLDDKLRVKVGAGFMDVRYKFYGIGNTNGDLDIDVDILQEAPMYFASASWRVWKKWYVGLGYLGGDVDTTVRFDLSDPPPYSIPTVGLDIGALTIPIEFDGRDHEQFPRNGWFVSGRTMLYRESLGSDFDAETFKLAINRYRPMGEKNVLALRAVFQSASDDVPFFLLSTFGGSTDLRGYPSGRYRDQVMYALQGEYRWQYSDRWIFTGFAGVGEVAESFGDIGKNFLPAAGIGARFVLSKKHRVGLSMDVAVGDDGTEYYFGIGEAF